MNMNEAVVGGSAAMVQQEGVEAILGEGMSSIQIDSSRIATVNEKIRAIQDHSLRTLLERQNALIERIQGLSELEDYGEAVRQKALLEAELDTVRADYAKRTEDIGVLSCELFEMYDVLGLQSQRAKEDAPEDIALRKNAAQAVEDAKQKLAALETSLQTANDEKTEIAGSWWPVGKQAKLDDADREITRINQKIIEAKSAIEEAEAYIPAVEEQIEVNRRDRIRKASLTENFALIRNLTAQATKILSGDIEETGKLIDLTSRSLNSALEKKGVTARDLDAVRQEIKTLESDIKREIDLLNEIPDQSSPAYAEQQKRVAGIEVTLTQKKGAELKLNTTHQAMTQAIEANRSSLMGLNVQRDTAEVYQIKLVNAEKTAQGLGRNIDRMLKNSTQEAASDNLDRVNDRMIQTAVALGAEAEVASLKTRNDAIARHDELMKQLNNIRTTADTAVAAEAKEYLEIDARIRQGYKDRGVNLEMGALAAASKLFEVSDKQIKSLEEDAVTY